MNTTSSLKLGEYFGIGVYLHWTFFIIPALVAFSAIGSGGGLAVAAASVLFVLSIFACVVLHEYGHALMARRYGIETRDITLYPIGGVARLERMPTRPSQELAVALAGPAVNVAIAFMLLAGIGVAANLGWIQPDFFSSNSFFINLMWVNVALVVFNMLPAFPMDGGRVLRSILAMNMSYLRASEIATGVGQFMALLLGVVGVFWSWNLILIAVFVYFAAAAELAQTRLNARLPRSDEFAREPDFAREPVAAHRETVPSSFYALRAESRVASIVDTLMASPQRMFPVMAGSRFVGMLFKGDVRDAVAKGWGHLQVADLVRHR